MFVFFCWRCVSKPFWISGEAPFPKQVQLKAISFLCNTHKHTVHTHAHTSFNKTGSGRGVHCRNFIQILYWTTWTLLPLQPSSQEIFTVLTTKTRWTDWLCVFTHTVRVVWVIQSGVCSHTHTHRIVRTVLKSRLYLVFAFLWWGTSDWSIVGQDTSCSFCAVFTVLSCKCDGLQVFTFIYLLFLVLLINVWGRKASDNRGGRESTMKRRNYIFCENESENWTTAEVC